MYLAFFVFIIGVAPAYFNEEAKTSQSLSIEPQSNGSFIQVQVEDGSKEKQNHNCPNKDVLLQTLNVLKENLIQDDNHIINPEKFKEILDNLIEYSNQSQGDDLNTNTHAQTLKDVLEKVNSRPKKEVLRISQFDESNPSDKLTGKVSLEYQLPVIKNGDCQTLFRAILNAINAAYLQMSMFCAQSGKCKLSNENIAPTQNSFSSGPPQETSFREIVKAPPTNDDLYKYIIALLGTYPQNADIMTLLQNYRPNSTSNDNFKNPPDNKQGNPFFIDGNGKTNDQTADKDNHVLEVYTVLDNPSGYTVNEEPIKSLPTNSENIPSTNTSNNIINGAESVNPPLSGGSIQINQNITSKPTTASEDVKLIKKVPNTDSSIMNSYVGNNNIALQGHQNGISNVINRNVYKTPPKFIDTDYNFMYPPQKNIQFERNIINAQNPPYSPPVYPFFYYPPPQMLNKHTQQNYNDIYRNPLNFRSPGINQFVTKYLPSNQRNMLINPQVNNGIPYITTPRLTNLHQNINNTVALQDLYRLTSMTNGPKLNIAPNKNGMIELTFTLQRPKTLEYNPVYYVKYILPYQTYMYNLQNLLQRRPFLRHNPAQLYQELLTVANITESSQDLKDLDKHEISKLVATNGALVKAKVLDDSSNSADAVMADEVHNILKLSSKLGAEGMLNATKMAVNNIDEVINNSRISNTTKDKEAVVVNATVNDDLGRSVNTRSLGNPFYRNPQFMQQAMNGVPYISPYSGVNNVYNPLGRGTANMNRQILFG